MSVRSIACFGIALALVFAFACEEASAGGKRGGLLKRLLRGRSASWGGSYGSVGSCGTPVKASRCKSKCSSAPVRSSCSTSFGSSGGCGGSYVSTGSSGGVIVSSTVVCSQPISSVPIEMGTSYSQAVPSETIIYSEPIEVVPHVHSDAEGHDHEHGDAEHEHGDADNAESEGEGDPQASDAASDDSVSVLTGTTPKPVVAQNLHAYLVLRNVPTDAEIYLLGVKMNARGAYRKYRIPVLDAEQDYKYEIDLRLPGGSAGLVSATTNVRSGKTTELWVADRGDEIVILDEDASRLESTPLALR